jgi:hypothetical protein
MSASSTSSRRRNARLLTAGAIVAGLAGSAAVVWHASYSAFSAQTTNPSSNWSAGTVNLTDDDSNTALFSATGLKPGSTGTKCIAVTSTGSLASAVKLYGTNPSTTKSLSSYINLTITQGTGGGFGSCTGFTALTTGSSVFSGKLDTFGSTKTDYASGAGDWAPTGSASDTRVYQITYTLDAATPNTSQGGTAAIGLTWEAQNS